LRDTQAAFTKVTQERAQLAEKIAELERAVEAIRRQGNQAAQPTSRDPFEFLDSENFETEFLEKPRESVKKIINTLGVILHGMHQDFESKIEAIKKELNRPPKTVLDRVAKLRQEHPELSDVPDDHLAKIVMVLGGQNSDESGKKEWPGEAGGGRRAAPRSSGDELNPKVREFMRRMGYE
jgi:hypothetical protein